VALQTFTGNSSTIYEAASADRYLGGDLLPASTVCSLGGDVPEGADTELYDSLEEHERVTILVLVSPIRASAQPANG
jgi:hypothetical protein